MATTIDETGFSRDRLDIIKANVDAAMEAIYGTDIDLGPSSPDGQYTAITAESADTVGQLVEDDYNSRSPDNATGAALSRLVRLNGITRNPATYSLAQGTHLGTPGTVIPDGSLIDTTDTPPAHFQTVGDVTIGADGTAPGTVRATTTGPVFGAAGAISVLKTVISGWTSFQNAADVVLGSDVETDPALRIRRAASVAIAGRAVRDAMYGVLANVQGVSDIAIFENKTGSPIPRPGAADLPPNSIQAVVQGGLDTDVANAIWTTATGGATLVGAQAVTVIDAQGTAQVIKFDRPTKVAVFAIVTLTYPANTGTPPSDALKAALAKALVDYGKSVAKMGALVVWANLMAPLVAVLGDVTKPSSTGLSGVSVGFSPTTTHGTDLVLPPTGIATWDVGNVAFGVFSYPG